MNRCPITYELCGETLYSEAGLRALSPSLKELHDFPYNAQQQRQEAILRTAKMSIQGMQPKLSVKLNLKEGLFEIVDQLGRFIIKPQHDIYPHLPENEGLTMQLAGLCGIETPVSGLIRCADGSWSYFIKRFDRKGHNRKLSLEDFAQLSGASREKKYDASMERIVNILDNFCTFPALEKVKLFKRCLFNFLMGNEDMHLKNFSMITRDNKVEIAPAYDFLNSTIALMALGTRIHRIEEIALPLRGKKRNLTRKDWIDYFGAERLKLNARMIERVLHELQQAMPGCRTRIRESFLPDNHKELYTGLLTERAARLELNPPTPSGPGE